MQKGLLIAGLIVATSFAGNIAMAAKANAVTQCKGKKVLLTFPNAGNKKLCAKIIAKSQGSYSFAISMKANSQMEKMHQTFPKAIYNLYEQKRAANKIPAGVMHDIQTLTYNKQNYSCDMKDMIILNKTKLIMGNCSLKK